MPTQCRQYWVKKYNSHQVLFAFVNCNYTQGIQRRLLKSSYVTTRLGPFSQWGWFTKFLQIQCTYSSCDLLLDFSHCFLCMLKKPIQSAIYMWKKTGWQPKYIKPGQRIHDFESQNNLQHSAIFPVPDSLQDNFVSSNYSFSFRPRTIVVLSPILRKDESPRGKPCLDTLIKPASDAII